MGAMKWLFWRKEPDPKPEPRALTRRVARAPKPAMAAEEPPAEPEEPPPLGPDELDQAIAEETPPPPPPKPQKQQRHSSRPELPKQPPPPPSRRDPSRPPAVASRAPAVAADTGPRSSPAERESRERLGELLVNGGIISQDALAQALNTQRALRADTYLGEILVRENLLSEEQLAHTISTQYRLPLIRLADIEVRADLLKLIPAADARRLRAIPVDRLGRILSVAMANPLDEMAVAELGQLTGLKIKPGICIGSELRPALDEYYPGSSLSRIPQVPSLPERQETARVRSNPPVVLTRTQPPHTSTAPEIATEPQAAVEAEAISEELFEASVTSNPEYILGRAPALAQRRKAIPARPISDAEFALFVGALPRS